MRPSQLLSCILGLTLTLLLGCSSRAGYYAHPHHHSHVSVNVHGHAHSSSAAAVVGALIIGGVIGHALAEAEQQQAMPADNVDSPYPSQTNSDAVVNGYPLEPQESPRRIGEIWYQQGQDGHCYLLQATEQGEDVVMMVPDKRCRHP